MLLVLLAVLFGRELGVEGGCLRGVSRLVSDADYRDNELAETHDSGAPEEERASAEALDHVERRWGGAHVDDVHRG